MISTEVVTDYNHLIKIESFWNGELEGSVENPFFIALCQANFLNSTKKKVGTPC